MLSVPAPTRVFLCTTATDMRKSFDGLHGLIVEVLRQDPLSGDWFVFLNRRRDRLKIMAWELDGFSIWYKQLALSNNYRHYGQFWGFSSNPDAHSQLATALANHSVILFVFKRQWFSCLSFGLVVMFTIVLMLVLLTASVSLASASLHLHGGTADSRRNHGFAEGSGSIRVCLFVDGGSSFMPRFEGQPALVFHAWKPASTAIRSRSGQR